MRFTLAGDHLEEERIVADVNTSPTNEATDERRLRVSINGQEWTVEVLRAGHSTLLLIGGKPYEVTALEPDAYQCNGRGTIIRAVRSTYGSTSTAIADPRLVVSPMPGRVVKVCCEAGQQVNAGAPLIVLEAMKMENELCAAVNGRVRDIFVNDGQSVERGARLVQLDTG